MSWKSQIIQLTELPEAQKQKIDATFFPPLSTAEISGWESEHDVQLPEEWRSFYRESNGMEAKRGEWQPIFPLEDCRILPMGCERPVPWLEFGLAAGFRFYVGLGQSVTVYRVAEFGSEEEFFGRNLTEHLRNLFRGGQQP